MTHEEMEAVVAGRHGDPFRILGPHACAGPGAQEHFEVRTFQPQARAVELLIGDNALPMERVQGQGFFIAKTSTPPGIYRLRIHRYDGRVEEIDDPYRFWPLLTDFDLHLHAEGTNLESYRTMGAHITEVDGVPGVRFAVWAPSAEVVSVVGDRNEWDSRRNPMRLRNSGVWELFLPGWGIGDNYKYAVREHRYGHCQLKADPYAFYAESPPHTASIVWYIGGYPWQDSQWMERRATRDILASPVSIYEVHLESWLRKERNRSLKYREFASELVQYVKRMGFTHVELLPPMEHPYAQSWGYQVTGFYAPTARFGTPQDFMYFVDCCHQNEIGVIIDWVPGHFPKDAHGLARFDGSALYEHEDPRQGEQPDWGTLVFNYGRNEVRGFLISNALFWLKQYHIDGLRVDAVASMLYLDFSREHGDWIPNRYGGRENLDAIEFLKRFNEVAHEVPGVMTIAEESTSFPGVSRPVYLNGLGFTMKWNMGWMHDMFRYFKQDPINRKYHHNDITFSMLYAFTENFVLPVSHDEVVHMKGSLMGKMPGDEWQRFANVRAFLSYMWTHPGKKLLFMGQEIGQYEEWNNNGQVRWELLQFDYHRRLHAMVTELNRLYVAEPALYEVDSHWAGFEWIDISDYQNSIISFLRRAKDPKDLLVFACNFTPVPRFKYRIGAPEPGSYREIFNSDSSAWGGSNLGNGGMALADPVPMHNRSHSLELTLPPLAVVAFKWLRPPEPPPLVGPVEMPDV